MSKALPRGNESMNIDAVQRGLKFQSPSLQYSYTDHNKASGNNETIRHNVARIGGIRAGSAMWLSHYVGEFLHDREIMAYLSESLMAQSRVMTELSL